MTASFDFVYQDRKCMAPYDVQRGFLSADMESLDAPAFMPAGSTESRAAFHVTSFTYRVGA
ncbi:hypothetical protein PQQ63_15210 [Paraburkholderia metrosideri]|uniref:Uncharacterized protein n=1 Tax=Paraburkholderia metrosideri TaxID=580937 RepID=A0ABW9DTV0_9BURK